jgi:DNA-binding MarR family transcriptional regulator
VDGTPVAGKRRANQTRLSEPVLTDVLSTHIVVTMTRDSHTQLVSDAVVALMSAGAHITRDLNAVCEDHGITHDQYNVLRILRGVHPEGHPRVEIASRLISRAPDVTRMLDRLERRGLVRRGWHPTNRRLSMASITRNGLALLDKVDVHIEQAQARFTEGTSVTDLQHLRRICRGLTG